MSETYLDHEFDRVIDNIRDLKDEKEIQKIIKKAIDVIYDEKIHQLKYDNVIEKLNELEKIIKSLNAKKPDRIDYIRASIYFEGLGKFKDAEKIYLDLINRKGVDKKIKDLSHFALCKLYLQDIDVNSKLNPDELENISKFKKHFLYLDTIRSERRNLDEYILRNFRELNEKFKEIEENRNFCVFKPNCEPEKYESHEKAFQRSISSSDILIDFTNFKVYIKGQEVRLTAKKIKYLYLLSKGTTNKNVVSQGIFKEHGVYQRIGEIRDFLKPYEFKVLDKNHENEKTYEIDPAVLVKVIYNIYDEIASWINEC